MEITSWTVSADRTTLDLVVTNAASASALRLWKTNTYKNYSDAIDLSSSLTASATETLSFTPTDLGEAYFDGVYFIEIVDPSEQVLAITSVFVRYKECVIERVREAGVCEECLEKEYIPMTIAHSTLRALEDAVELGFIDEIIEMVATLDTYCSDTCNSCGQYDNEEDDGYYTLNA